MPSYVNKSKSFAKTWMRASLQLVEGEIAGKAAAEAHGAVTSSVKTKKWRIISSTCVKL